MNLRLQRFAKRRAAWIEAAAGKISIDELQAVEFKHRDGGPDLHPSVYLIEQNHAVAVRAYAEHVAAAPIDPPKMTIALDTTDVSQVPKTTPGSAKFSFIRERHRELCFDTVEKLKALLHHIVSAFDSRHEEITRAEVIQYAQGRIKSGDEEWYALIRSEDGRKKEWIQALARIPDD